MLINNSGTVPDFDTHSVLDVDIAQARNAYATNVLGPWQLTQALLPPLRNAPAARIVNVSSPDARQVTAGAGLTAGMTTDAPPPTAPAASSGPRCSVPTAPPAASTATGSPFPDNTIPEQGARPPNPALGPNRKWAGRPASVNPVFNFCTLGGRRGLSQQRLTDPAAIRFDAVVRVPLGGVQRRGDQRRGSWRRADAVSYRS